MEDLWDDIIQGKVKRHDDLEQIEKEDRRMDRDVPKIIRTAESIFRRTLDMFLLQERVFSRDTVRLWSQLNRAASLDRSPAPLLTPPLQYALGIPVFMHLFYSALPKTRFIQVPSAIALLHKIAEVCDVCGSPACRQDDPLICEEAQREWVRYTKVFHGENLTPRPDNLDSTKYDNLSFHMRVLDCHPGTIFYYSLPSLDLVNARAVLRLCVLCGLRHATYGFEACLTKVIRARDAASKTFLNRDIDNAERVEEFKNEEEETWAQDGPAVSDSVTLEDEQRDEVTRRGGVPEVAGEGPDTWEFRTEELLKERTCELGSEEREVEDQEKEFLERRRELEVLASQIRVRRLGLAREKRRLIKAHRVYEERMEEFKEDETQRWILAEMWTEVDDLCTTEFWWGGYTTRTLIVKLGGGVRNGLRGGRNSSGFICIGSS
jgi:hypothetical protein